jgi:hypothetical protein
MSTTITKSDAHKLIDKMPENSTWDDLIDEIYVRQVIEKGLTDSNAGRITAVSDLRKRYFLN